MPSSPRSGCRWIRRRWPVSSRRRPRPPVNQEKNMLDNVVDLSRLQFAATAMYHFLFVPLTLGMVWLLVMMESVWVMTGKQVYQDMTKFWGKLFGINFALGVTTGIRSSHISNSTLRYS